MNYLWEIRVGSEGVNVKQYEGIIKNNTFIFKDKSYTSLPWALNDQNILHPNRDHYDQYDTWDYIYTFTTDEKQIPILVKDMVDKCLQWWRDEIAEGLLTISTLENYTYE